MVLNVHTGALCVPLCSEVTFGSQRVLIRATNPVSRAFTGDCPALTASGKHQFAPVKWVGWVFPSFLLSNCSFFLFSTCVGGSQFKPNLATNDYSQTPLLRHLCFLLQVAPFQPPGPHLSSVPLRVCLVSDRQSFLSASQAGAL